MHRLQHTNVKALSKTKVFFGFFISCFPKNIYVLRTTTNEPANEILLLIK